MSDQHIFVSPDHFHPDAYTRSQTAGHILNTAIVGAEISRSFEEYLESFDDFYADDIEVSKRNLERNDSRNCEGAITSPQFPGATTCNGRSRRCVHVDSRKHHSWRRRRGDTFCNPQPVSSHGERCLPGRDWISARTVMGLGGLK